MGGIIAGFLGGASAAMADAGKMMLADKLAKEREEANFLRESELRKALKADELGFTEEQNRLTREADQAKSEADRASREKIAEGRNKATLEAANIRAQATRESSGAAKPTNQQKNINDLINRGWSEESAVAHVYPGATIKYDGPEGERVVVQRGKQIGDEKEIGRFMTNDRGAPEFVGLGDQPTRTKATKDQRKAIMEIWNSEGHEKNKALWFDWDLNDKELKEFANDLVKSGQYEQYISGAGTAMEGQNSNQAQGDAAPGSQGPAQDSPGLVGRQMPGQEVKTINGREMNKQQFIEAMVARYGRDKMAQIEETWNSIK